MSFVKKMLHWLEGILQINMQYFSKNIPIILFNHFVGLCSGFLVTYLATRLLVPELYGQYRLILSILGVVSVLKFSSISTAIAQAAAHSSRIPLWFTLKTYAPWILLGSGIVLLSLPVLLFYNRLELWYFVIIAALLFPFDAFGITFFSGLISGKSLFGLELKTTFIVRTVTIVFAGVALFFYKSPVLLFVATYGVPALIYSWYAFGLTKQFSSTDQDSSIFRYGFSLSIVSIPTVLVWYLDSLLISALFGLKELALFSVLLIAPNQAKQVVKSVMTVTFSRQAKGKDSWSRRMHLLKLSAWGTVCMLVLYAVLFILAPWILELLFPQYYSVKAVWLLRLALILILLEPISLLRQYLEAQKKLRELFWSQTIASAALAISLIIMVPTIGITGALVSRIIFRAVFIALMLYLLFKPVVDSKSSTI